MHNVLEYPLNPTALAGRTLPSASLPAKDGRLRATHPFQNRPKVYLPHP